MGKPSTQKSNKSFHNLRSNSSERKMNVAASSMKVEKINRRKWSKKNQKIKSLFQKLRNQSNSQSSIIHDQSSSSSITVINLEDTIKTPKKRKLSPANSAEKLKIKKPNGNATVTSTTIVIHDDDSHCVGTPRKTQSQVHCSTPIGNGSVTALNDLNVSSISNTKNNNSIVQNFNREVDNLTKEINIDSYLTIDLTAESTASKCLEPVTVIDLNTVSESQDCILLSENNSQSSSISGASEVTVLRARTKQSEERKIRRFANGIANLDASSKGKLLELITQKIFSGCDIPKTLKANLRESRATETVEDTYIKEVILGQRPSRNSIGSNIYNPEKDAVKTGLRMVVIDGSNVAMEHGRGRVFSVKGLKICIDYFLNRGHTVKAFVPRFRCKFGKSTEPRLLDELERRGLLVYTPSREVQGRMITSYDDRYIVQCAAEFDGVIVSGDNYRDLLQENQRWRSVIEKRLLPFTWVEDMIMFPRDPLGRNGPTLEQFLRHVPESQ